MAAERRLLAVVVGGALTLVACAGPPTVEVERSMTAVGELSADRDPVIAGSPATPRSTDDESTERPAPSASSISWGSCSGFGIPPADQLDSGRWECARLDVAMDPADPFADLPPVSLALTRHPATGDRIGSLVINPGGPGGAGLPLAWNLRSAMPTDLLRSFDIVSWDPRGVGQSRPAMSCPPDVPPDGPGFIAGCVDSTGPLSGFVAAPYTVADMESIRVALGEPELDFLGFSYGSVLGATYAARHPDRVGSFVLDGVTDPEVGTPDGPFSGGFATYADDGLSVALDRFEELCAVATQCLGRAAVDDVDARIDRIVRDAGELPTADHDGSPETLTTELVEDHLAASMLGAAEWELLAAGLRDADVGDGSNLAAHVGDSDVLTTDPAAPEDGAAPDNFEAANFLIYCADLGPLITRWPFCDDMPVAADPLGPVVPVELERPILLIGTEYDPLTPGYHAPEFAAALGDAVWMIWDGVGHTAFPGWTDCIDDAVADHVLRRGLPGAGTRCDFVEGVADDVELADGLFGFDVRDARPWLTEELVGSGRVSAAEIDCVVRALVPDDDVDDLLVAEVILGVTTDPAEEALAAALATC